MIIQVRFLSEWIAVQAAPKLGKIIGIPMNLLPEHMIYGLTHQKLDTTLKKYRKFLEKLMNEHNLSWWDIYINSDVGKERLALAEKMNIEKIDVALDVGCGRGYFTIALATFCDVACSLDLMNGYGRKGWWTNFRSVMRALELDGKVMGERSSAERIPFRDGSFSLTVSVHALRNIRDRPTIINTLKEMHRVTRKGGRVIIAENLPEARTKAQEAHLRMFEVQTRYVRGDNPLHTETEVIEMFKEAGMTPIRKQIFDFNLSATPPIFALNINSLPEELRENAETNYLEAVEMIRKYGELSTPVLLVETIVG